MKKAAFLFAALFAISMVNISCEKEETKTNQQNQNPQSKDYSYYFFHDDNLECTPYSQFRPNPSIVSVVSNPCQNSSAKLDMYFKYNVSPTNGTYDILATTSINTNPSEGTTTLIFYNHANTTWYAQSGKVEVSTNANDASKIDIKFNALEVEGVDGSSTKFTGQLIGI